MVRQSCDAAPNITADRVCHASDSGVSAVTSGTHQCCCRHCDAKWHSCTRVCTAFPHTGALTANLGTISAAPSCMLLLPVDEVTYLAVFKDVLMLGRVPTTGTLRRCSRPSWPEQGLCSTASRCLRQGGGVLQVKRPVGPCLGNALRLGVYYALTCITDTVSGMHMVVALWV
jgi:hypothetical protein